MLTALVMLFIFSVIIPIILILFMKLIKIIGSITTPTKTERILISLIISIFIFELYLFYSKMYPFNILFRRYLIIIILLVIFTIIFKFSYHSYGAGAMLGLTLLYYFSSITKYLYSTDLHTFLLLFLITGLMLTSRIVTGAHNFIQIIKGFVFGLTASVITYVFF